MIGPRYVVTLLAVVGLLSGGTVGAAYLSGAGPFAADPALTGFETEPARCATGIDGPTGSTTTISSAGDRTEVTLERTVRVPDPAHAVANASVERTAPGEYTLSVHTVENDSVAAPQCVAVANYTATVTVPEAADERFTVVVREDGERVGTVENGPNGAGASDRAVGGDPAANATGTV